MRNSLYFLRLEPELESREIGVGYKVPPDQSLQRIDPSGLLWLPTLYVTSLRTPSAVRTSSTMGLSVHPSGLPKGPLSFTVSHPSTAIDYSRTSSKLRQRPSFPDNEISIVTRLLPYFYGGRPPSEFQPSSCDSQTSTTSGLLRTSTTSGLPRTPAASSLLRTLTTGGLFRIPTSGPATTDLRPSFYNEAGLIGQVATPSSHDN